MPSNAGDTLVSGWVQERLRQDTDVIFPGNPEPLPALPENIAQVFAEEFGQVSEETRVGSILFEVPPKDGDAGGDERKRFEIPSELGIYKIERTLGRGGFTIVYLAQDRTSWLGRNVALKIPARQRLDEQWKHRILREAKVWRVLSERPHPNIAHFVDLKRIGPVTCFVMEYMDGGDLASALSRLDDSKRIPAIIDAFEQICDGLAFAHRRGVVHGDIKPGNILVSKDLKTVKLADFGLSILLGEISGEEAKKPIAGTPMFMAPECFDGQRSPQTDIYGLGITLYYLLTGEYPFKLGSTSDFKELKAERVAFRPNSRSMRTIRSDIPAWLDEVVQRCLAPNPEERFSSGVELAEHITPFIDPSKGHRIVLTAWCNSENQTVDYDLEVKGQRSREMLTVEFTFKALEGLCAQWDQLGRLALRRVERRSRDLTTTEIDEKIRELLLAVAEDGAQFMLGPRVREMLRNQQAASLWLLHDPRLAAVPWELFDINGKYPSQHLCRRFPMARWPRLHRGRGRDSRLQAEEKIRVLLVTDPCGDLPGAKEEGERLQEAISEFAPSALAERLIVEVADQSVDTFTMRSKIRRCHILHFAGHAVVAERHGDLSQSGWLLRGDIDAPESTDDLLRASALEGLWTEKPPLVVFANACASGRGDLKALQYRLFSDAAMGLAQAFLAAGVESYVGTVWEAPDDDTTTEFAIAFYRELLAGRTVGQALLTARNMSAKKFGEEDLTWARYVLFGDPHVHIPLK